MELCVISVGKISYPPFKESINLFETRLNRYIKYTSVIIPDIKKGKTLAPEALKEEEGKAILSLIGNSDYVVLLDEKGLEFSSRKFATWIENQMIAGKKRVVMVIGGPFGFSQDVYDRANFKIALSQMTFTHEMAKLFLTEQLYRAMTILKNEPYHHD